MSSAPPRHTSPTRPGTAGSDKSDKSGKSAGSNNSGNSAGSGNSFKTAASKASATSGNSAGSGGTTGSNSSYASAFSNDSYLENLKKFGIKTALLEMLGAIVMIGSDDLDTMIEARKKLSHEQKKRDPNDKERRVWSDQMVEEYNVYKAAVEALEKAKKVQEESTGLAMAKGNAKLPVEQQERLRNKALDDDEKWVAAAIRAASARLLFMKRWPNAFNTESFKTHIEAAEHNLNSVKNALEERQRQREQIRKVHEVAAQKAAAAERKAAKEAAAKKAGASAAAAANPAATAGGAAKKPGKK